MATETVTSDMGIGVGLTLGAVTAVGTGLMLLGATQSVKAWGFALAMLAATLAVVAVQVYGA